MAMEAVAVELREMRMVSAPGYGRLFPSRSTKPAKEDSAAVSAFFDDIVVTKHPQAERKMAVAGTGAGNKAAAAAVGGIVKAASGAGNKAAAAGGGIVKAASGAGNKAAAAAGGGIVKAASWSDMENLVAGAGNKVEVPAPLPAFPVRPGKKTKVVPVSDEEIKCLETDGPLPPPICPPEEVRLWSADSLEERELWDCCAEMLEQRQALADHETAILEQYRKYGYAYKMVVVDVDDKV